MERLLTYDPIFLAFIATMFTWLVTAAGSALVFFFKRQNKKLLNTMLGFAAGVMIAASFWSLLDPAIAIAEERGMIPWLVAVVGFLVGGAFIYLLDKLLPYLFTRLKADKDTGERTSWQRSVLLVFAITLHNIPEGLAVGVAFGALGASMDPALLYSAMALAFGIGLQNFPEGAAVSIPLRREGYSRGKAFFYGQFSGFVQPLAGVAGAWMVVAITPLLPFALAFAAGAMIYVVAKELIPESHAGEEAKLATIGVMLGFAVMMALDVALG